MRKPGHFPYINPAVPRIHFKSTSKIKAKRRQSMRMKSGWFPTKFKQSSLIASFGRARKTKPFDQTIRSKTRFKYTPKKFPNHQMRLISSE